jgi:acetoacetyl-CoA synthetase
MWNWLASFLSTGSTIVLYDGSPFFPNKKSMWNLIDELNITIFGTSAKFIDACKNSNTSPKNFSKLSSLKQILSTGSPLVPESFDYVYDHIKEDVLLGSISGGTDIISCFVLNNPTLPVYRGEIQCRGLGMDVDSFDETGKAVRNQKGELVCKTPFPSMPVSFWDDDNGEKFNNAYFNKYQNTWAHGDFIEINDHGGVIIYGRSDATLNPGGVRIGTAEIYRIVETFKEVEDSLVVGQEWENDQRIILFLKISSRGNFSKLLLNTIKQTIKTSCSPRHVPSIILPVKDIPYTISGKKVELAVKNIIQGNEVFNKDALANPESLDLFRAIPELS